MTFHTNINAATSVCDSVDAKLPILDPSAVTASSMSAHVMDDGGGWTILGLGTLAMVSLGAVVLAVARKR